MLTKRGTWRHSSGVYTPRVRLAVCIVSESRFPSCIQRELRVASWRRSPWFLLFLSFLFSFQMWIWYHADGAKNTMHVNPQSATLQRHSEPERTFVFGTFPSLPFLDPWFSSWAAHASQPRRSRADQASPVRPWCFSLEHKWFPQNVNITWGHLMNRSDGSRHNQAPPRPCPCNYVWTQTNRSIVWTKELMKTTTYPGSFEWLQFHQSWSELLPSQ